MVAYMISRIPFIIGWLLDRVLGDPESWPHPVVWFGKLISMLEKKLNRGKHRMIKGGMMGIVLILGVFFLINCIVDELAPYPIAGVVFVSAGVFFCLAGTTLIREVREVFAAADCSLEAGRRQVSRIVGRDTANLSGKEIRTAALETLSENLSDGVIAPMFWYALLGLPGMMAYKMVNTLDSMIGYKSPRYKDFGYVSAKIDDLANYIPARLTAMLMILASGRPSLLRFVMKYGSRHASPNSGWPEAALAGILDCRFGGPHDYFGESVYKPYIGINERDLTNADMLKALRVNRIAEIIAVILVCLV